MLWSVVRRLARWRKRDVAYWGELMNVHECFWESFKKMEPEGMRCNEHKLDYRKFHSDTRKKQCREGGTGCSRATGHSFGQGVALYDLQRSLPTSKSL